MSNSTGSSKLFIATHCLLIYQTLVIVTVVIWFIGPNKFLISTSPWGSVVDVFHHRKKGGNEKINMDTYFISHGSPTLAIEDLPARRFLKAWQNVLPQKPKAILVVSAHWDTAVPHINIVERNSTIHDFYGFPDEMYKLQYNAPGAPDLAKRVKELLLNAGFKTVNSDFRRGLDHGAWVPLSLMYPDADIPVCQLSVQSRRSGTYHYEMGRALAPLRSEGVLIIGSGSATHNLRALYDNDSPPPSWALQFDKWLTESLIHGRFNDVNHFEEKAPYARTAHPYPDHYYPLNVALGAAGEGAKAEQIHNSWSHGALSYSSYAFKPTQ